MPGFMTEIPKGASQRRHKNTNTVSRKQAEEIYDIGKSWVETDEELKKSSRR
jgi:hypothetical protein